MARTAAITIRVEPELKAAVARAAADDDRSVAGYLERLMRAHLTERGYLTDAAAPAAKPARRPGGRRGKE